MSKCCIIIISHRYNQQINPALVFSENLFHKLNTPVYYDAVNFQVNGERSDGEIFDDLSRTIEEILQKKKPSDVTLNLKVPVLVSFELI